MQVYLHKTVLSADTLLRNIFKRVADILSAGHPLVFASPKLEYFIKNKPSARKSISRKTIDMYTAVDDYDVYQNIKEWQFSDNEILSNLCTRFLNRDLFRTTFLDGPPSEELQQRVLEETITALHDKGLAISEAEAEYYFSFEKHLTEAYKYHNDSIWILENEIATEFSKAADTKNIIALTEPLVRYFCVHIKELVVVEP
jgi:hypothetical protein